MQRPATPSGSDPLVRSGAPVAPGVSYGTTSVSRPGGTGSPANSSRTVEAASAATVRCRWATSPGRSTASTICQTTVSPGPRAATCSTSTSPQPLTHGDSPDSSQPPAGFGVARSRGGPGSSPP